MLVSLKGSNVAYKVISIQLLVVTVSGGLFCLKSPLWGVSALGGGLAIWLPNVLFMVFAWHYRVKVPAQRKVVWILATGEALKVIFTFALLILALTYFKADFVPLLVTWLLVLVVQLLVLVVIDNKG